jgi:hypothetical protein
MPQFKKKITIRINKRTGEMNMDWYDRKLNGLICKSCGKKKMCQQPCWMINPYCG